MLSHLNGVTSYGWRVSELRGVAHRHDHGGGRLPAPVRVQVAGLPPWEDALAERGVRDGHRGAGVALDALKTHRAGVGAVLQADGAGGVSLYRRDDKTLVVVRQSPLADAVRGALPIGGWRSHLCRTG